MMNDSTSTLASKDSYRKHVTAYRHMTKCRLRGQLPRFFCKQAKDYAGNTCGFFVHRNASSRSELTFYSQFFGNIDDRLISKKYGWAENFVNTSVSTKLPTSTAKRLPARSASAQSHRRFGIRFYAGVAAVRSQARKLF